MPGIDAFLEKRSGQATSRYQGTVVQPNPDDPALAVNVAGNVLAARVIDPLVVAVGDSVLVDVVREARGLGAAWVVGRAASSFSPAQGTVKTVPVGSETITVTGTDGIDYTATFLASYTPVVGDRVTLDWSAAVPNVNGEVGLSAAPPPPDPGVAPPPAPSASGQSTFRAVDSSTFWGPGGWGSWNKNTSPSGVFQGNYGGLGDLTGAWWYGGATTQLQGKNVTGIRILFGARRPVGSSNAAATVHVKTHTSANRPGGNVTFGSGATDITADPGQGPREYDLPLSFGPDLKAGGGIAIFGNPYAGFDGVLARPDSGLLIIDWTS